MNMERIFHDILLPHHNYLDKDSDTLVTRYNALKVFNLILFLDLYPAHLKPTFS